MTAEISFFASKSKKEKVLYRGQNGFQCEDNNNNNSLRHTTSIRVFTVTQSSYPLSKVLLR